MKYLFWCSGLLIVYTYAGYPIWLAIRSRFRPRPVRRDSFLPTVTVVMVVRNEAQNLPRKIENLSALDYPAEMINFVIVSDASTDSTNSILGNIADPRFRKVLVADRRGKACGLNQAIQVANGDILVFTDARQQIEIGAVRLLMENFADEKVGCASGELMLGEANQLEADRGMGVYWRVEKNVRKLESASGSVVGATGALYAARRSLLTELPADTILDDVYLPMHIAKQGGRVVFDDRACAWDQPNLGERREFARKVRTLTGNYQLLQLAPWLLTSGNPLRFEFVSHKLLRLVIPFALATALLSSALVREPLYRVAGGLQLIFYAVSVLGFARLRRSSLARVTDAARTFVVLNAAALVAFKNFVTGRKVVWS